jgi:O-antigen/teichoic acid export membrane protein
MSLEKKNLTTLMTSASLVLVGSIIGSLSKMIEQIIIARTLTPRAYGDVSLALAMLSLGTTISLIGFNQGVPRYVSRFTNNRDIRGVWITSLLISIPFTIVLVLTLLVNIEHIVEVFFETGASKRLVVLFVLCIPFVTGLELGIGSIRGLENTLFRTYVRDLFYPGFRIILVVGLLYTGFGVLAAGYAYLITAITAVLFAHILLNRLVPLVGQFNTHSKHLLTFSLPLVLSSVLGLLLTRTDTLLVGYFRTSYEVGLYSAAYPLANGLLIILASFGFLYLPLASRLDADERRDEIDAIYKLTTKWVVIITFPLFLTFVVFSGDILSIVFGPEYADASLSLSILSIGFFTSAVGGRNRETLAALGMTKFIFLANAIAFVLNIVLNLILIPRYGYLGAAGASAFSYAILNAVVLGILERKFDISPFSKRLLKILVIVPLLLFPPTIFVSRWVSLTLLTGPLVLLIVGIACVYIVCVTGCLQPEDRIPLELIENRLDIHIPFVWRYVPEAPSSQSDIEIHDR